MRKLLLTLLTFVPLCLCAQTNYDLWIGNTQVTSLNAADVLGDGKVSFSAANPQQASSVNTLTLKGATLTQPIKIGLANLTIDIQGTNSITTEERCIQKMENTTPAVTFTSTSTEVGSLTLKGADGVNSVGEYNVGSFIISDKLALIQKKDGYIYSDQYYFTDGSTKEAKLSPSYGVTVGGMQICPDNAADVIGEGIGDGNQGGMVSFDKATSTLTLINAELSGEIATSLTNLNIYLIGTDSLSKSYNGPLFLSKTGDPVTITFSTSTVTPGSLWMSLSYNNGGMIGDNVTMSYTAPLEFIPGSYKSSTDSYGTAAIGKSYGLSVSNGSTPIYAGIEDDVTGNGTISYDPDNKIITLNGLGMAFGSADQYGIIVGNTHGNLTINLLGKNYISDGSIVKFEDTTAQLTFTTNSQLPGYIDQFGSISNLADANIQYLNSLVYTAKDPQVPTSRNTIAVPTSNYGISISTDVANFEVTNNNRANVLGDVTKSVQYNGQGILTLNGATLQSISINPDIFNNDSLIIYLKGENSIINDVNGVADAILYNGDPKIINFATGDGSTTALQPGTLDCTYADNSATVKKLFGDYLTISYSNNLSATLENHTAKITAEMIPIVNNEQKTQINDGNGNGLGKEIKDYIDSNLSGLTPSQITDAFGEGITINKILYILPHNDDGYEVISGSNVLDLNSQMSKDNVETIAQMLYDGDIIPGSEDFNDAFHGLCFLIPAGEGKIVLEVNTSTAGELHVLVGINNPVVIKNKPTFETIEIPYEVQNETYVLIYSTVNPSNVEASRLYASHRAPGRKLTTTTQIRSAGVRASSVSNAPEPPLTPKELKKSDMVAPNIVDGQYATNYKIGQVDDGNVASIADDAFEGLDVTCMDLSETALSGLTVDRDKLPWINLPYSAYIYLPTGNKVKEGQQNVVIGGVCMNAELLEDNPFEITKDFKAKKIELKRNFTGMDGKKCSIMLPFALDKTTAATLGTFYKMIDGGAGDANDGKVHMQPVTETEANVPYMFMPNIDKIILESIKVEAATSSPEYTIKGMTFKGCFEKTTIEFNGSANYYCFVDDQFVRVLDNSVTVKTFRAYMTADASDASFSNTLDIDWGDGTTSIKNMKVGINDNIYYDLQGRRVLYPQKGIYIVNGKKVILK